MHWADIAIFAAGDFQIWNITWKYEALDQFYIGWADIDEEDAWATDITTKDVPDITE